jgi:hypothetical protein
MRSLLRKKRWKVRLVRLVVPSEVSIRVLDISVDMWRTIDRLR